MPPQPTAPAPKRNGCLIALMVLGGLAGLICIGSSIAVFIAARSDTGKKIFGAIDQSVRMAELGANAPGADELRTAGCPEAFVMDMNDAMAIVGSFIDAGAAEEAYDYLRVSCSTPAGSTVELPGCDALAAVFAKAAETERDFVMEAKHEGQQKAECRKRFKGDGTFVEDLRDTKF